MVWALGVCLEEHGLQLEALGLERVFNLLGLPLQSITDCMALTTEISLFIVWRLEVQNHDVNRASFF